jgi:hypothetical protein
MERMKKNQTLTLRLTVYVSGFIQKIVTTQHPYIDDTEYFSTL